MNQIPDKCPQCGAAIELRIPKSRHVIYRCGTWSITPDDPAIMCRMKKSNKKTTLRFLIYGVVLGFILTHLVLFALRVYVDSL
jgi:hypothetical protein